MRTRESHKADPPRSLNSSRTLWRTDRTLPRDTRLPFQRETYTLATSRCVPSIFIERSSFMADHAPDARRSSPILLCLYVSFVSSYFVLRLLHRYLLFRENRRLELAAENFYRRRCGCGFLPNSSSRCHNFVQDYRILCSRIFYKIALI